MQTTNLSRRGEEASSHVGENQIWDVLANLYHSETNPGGMISLGVAENALMHDELARFFESKFRVPTAALTYGDGPIGSKRLRASMAKFLTSQLRPVIPIKPEHIVVTNGVTTAVEDCSWALANPGDGFLLGQPYYRAFLADITLRPGVKVVTVPFGQTDPFGVDCVAKYEEAIIQSENAGVKVKGFVLCHPHNPLGRCYPRETIMELMKLCQKYNIHLISDEIYALSVWENKVDTEPTPVKFESALSIDTTDIMDPSLLHLVWGVSKDFGANGLRLGAIISQSNKALLDACKSTGLYTYASSLSDTLIADLLEDEVFVNKYIRTNQERLSDAHKFAVEILRRHNIEYATGANAAFFLWVNLGKAYLEKHPEEVTKFSNLKIHENETSDSRGSNGPSTLTMTIYDKLMAKKVFLASGDVTGAEEPGWFRLVFSQPREYLELGLRRIVEAIS